MRSMVIVLFYRVKFIIIVIAVCYWFSCISCRTSIYSICWKGFRVNEIFHGAYQWWGFTIESKSYRACWNSVNVRRESRNGANYITFHGSSDFCNYIASSFCKHYKIQFPTNKCLYVFRVSLWISVSFESTLMDSLAMWQKLWRMALHRLTCCSVNLHYFFNLLPRVPFSLMATVIRSIFLMLSPWHLLPVILMMVLQ